MMVVLFSGAVPCLFWVSRVQPLGLSSASPPPPHVCPCSTLAVPALQVVGVAHTFVEVWQAVAALLAELDVLLGFAELSVSAPTPYVRPQMLPADGGELFLVRNSARQRRWCGPIIWWLACVWHSRCLCVQQGGNARLCYMLHAASLVLVGRCIPRAVSRYFGSSCLL